MATVTRRDFLTLAGVALSSSVLPASLTACSSNVGGGNAPNLTTGPQPDFTTTLIRPTDLLSLTIGFVNLHLSGDSKSLDPIQPGDPAYILVDFGPQHLLEKTNPPAGPAAVQSLLAGNSRVVFVVPAGQSLEYSVASLLTAFSTLDMNVSTLATPNVGVTAPKAASVTRIGEIRQQRAQASLRALGAPGGAAAPDQSSKPSNAPNKPPVTLGSALPSAPTGWDTTLELPTRLVLAPNQYGAWAHAVSEVTSSTSQRTELWHTRLGVRVAGGVDESDAHADARTVRAIWTRDHGFHADVNPNAKPPDSTPGIDTDFAAMRALDRADIVFESANFASHAPTAIQVNRLMLTSLGGWLDARANFGENPPSGLSGWEQRTTMGRDHYVKLVHTGILFPFGHRANAIQISERRLTSDGAEALSEHSYIIVRQPVVAYDAKSNPGFPFTQVEIKTLSTPELIVGGALFAPQLADGSLAYYRFKMVGTDHSGREVPFESTAVWVQTEIPVSKIPSIVASASVGALQTEFDKAGRTSTIDGQRVAFAAEIPASAASTMMTASNPNGATFETQSLTHAGKQGPDWPQSDAGKVPFLPQMEKASIAVEALRGLAGLQAVDVAYHGRYLDHGFDPAMNAGELLLQLASANSDPTQDGTPVDFSKHRDQTGGFVNPNVAVNALSRSLGPVAGAGQTVLRDGMMVYDAATNIANGSFDPKDFLKTLVSGLSGAKVFGVFDLTDIIPAPVTDAFKKAPKFLTQALNEIETLIADAEEFGSLVKDIQDAANAGTVPAPLQPFIDLATQIATQATALVTHIQGAVTSVTVPQDPAPDVKAAAAALAALPPLLAQVPGVLGGQASNLAVAKLTNLATLMTTFADTFGQATQALGSTFTTLMDAYVAGQDLVKNLTLKLNWHTPVAGFPSGVVATNPPNPDDIFDPNGGLLLAAELRLKSVGAKPAGLDLLCGLEAFDINLFGGSSTFLSIHFEKLQFVLKSGQKANVDVVLAKPGMEFKGPLSFVQTITSVIPLDGFSDPPGISISTSGIEASFSIPLPTLSIGVFALSNISIGAGFKIPFIGDPVSVNFDFCTRENPFVLTVMFLGGGGFFGITLDPNGIKSLEAAFEVGAGIAVDFGVASGSLSAMLGIYFKMEFDSKTNENHATLTGYFRLRGEVDVLGIITASIELYLELSYESSSGKCTGTATLDIDVSVFFFHASVTLTCQKRFSGGNNDPSFWDMMHAGDSSDPTMAPFTPRIGDSPWLDYLGAFAA